MIATVDVSHIKPTSLSEAAAELRAAKADLAQRKAEVTELHRKLKEATLLRDTAENNVECAEYRLIISAE